MEEDSFGQRKKIIGGMACLCFCSTTTGGSHCSYVVDEAEVGADEVVIIKNSSMARNPSWSASQDGRPGLMKLGAKEIHRGNCMLGFTFIFLFSLSLFLAELVLHEEEEVGSVQELQPWRLPLL
ncbi:uncharacterized protein DS421_14g456940 [Arachis hypogaea]|nr:uncharacterized protein DS421_14g456940 [Arachis hypogaea]